MRLFFIIASFTLTTTASSQLSLPTEKITEKEIEFPLLTEDIEQMECLHYCIFPEEPSVDLEKWTTYLNDSLVLDEASLDTIPPGKYTVIVQFEVGAEGKLSNISILKEPGYGLGERVKKVISKCIRIWKPVIDNNGQITRNYRKQPITFVVEESCEELPEALTL